MNNHNADERLNLVKKALQTYEREGISSIKLPDDMNHNDFVVWRLVFGEHQEVFDLLCIEEVTREAEMVYALNKSGKQNLEYIALVCSSTIGVYVENKYYKHLLEEVIKIWLNEFKYVDGFKESVLEAFVVYHTKEDEEIVRGIILND